MHEQITFKLIQSLHEYLIDCYSRRHFIVRLFYGLIVITFCVKYICFPALRLYTGKIIFEGFLSKFNNFSCKKLKSVENS